MSEAIAELLRGIIDYAGLFPPAALDLPHALRNYTAYRGGPYAWMLGRFVIPASLIADAPAHLPLSVVAPDTKREHAGEIDYIEIPITTDPANLPARAKIRTGGLKPESYPTAEALAGFLHRAAAARVPFKATAGLHHPLPDPPMHGFVNLFLAAALLWHGGSESDALATLRERDFHFDGEARWSAGRLTVPQIREARRDFAISFGSCSFEEPIEDLKQLGWL